MPGRLGRVWRRSGGYGDGPKAEVVETRASRLKSPDTAGGRKYHSIEAPKLARRSPPHASHVGARRMWHFWQISSIVRPAAWAAAGSTRCTWPRLWPGRHGRPSARGSDASVCGQLC
jgi:hypothetical protein